MRQVRQTEGICITKFDKNSLRKYLSQIDGVTTVTRHKLRHGASRKSRTLIKFDDTKTHQAFEFRSLHARTESEGGSGTVLENRTVVQNERGVGIGFTSVTEIGIKRRPGLKLTLIGTKEQRINFTSPLTELRSLTLWTNRHKKQQNYVYRVS
ncbi:hypothetical protein EVAR_16382_1 [Eumeta japonica]|uniref:Uncharacterized protein n=1 Tax=Eumeta variegata TaxID=151549 RepID=A0A4C1VT13_EUMVA|nr:hypothetical protein EVAR_16382_1 [Eumeta japonica]